MSGRRTRSALIVAGEESGDLLGGDLVRAVRRLGPRDFFGCGGESMRQAGVELIETVQNMAVFGFLEALQSYRRLKRLAAHLLELAVERRIEFAILIDYPGFNLYLARLLHDRGLRVVYLVSPQIWAWKFNRIKAIRRDVDLMLTLFPFEKEIYDQAGVRAECVGHPMVQRIPQQLKRQKPIARKQRRTLIGLLPGSRSSEITRLLPDMLEAAHLLKNRFPRASFLLPGVNPNMEEFIHEQLARRPDLSVEYVTHRGLRVMEAADLLILASGTASLEAVWFRRPMVIVYRIGWINFLIASLATRTKYIGLPNILARRQVAVELIQSEVTPENIAREAKRILEDTRFRQEIVRELGYVRRSLGRGDPAVRAARAIQKFLHRRK